MELVLWTDERLDDMVAHNESKFDLVLTEIRDLRVEMRTEMRELRRQMHQGWIAMFSAQIAMFAAIVAHGL